MIFIRADSNPVISGGHIMRCIALAKAFEEVGKATTFLIADNNPVPVLEEAGMRYIELGSDWQDLMKEVDTVITLLRKENAPFLIIDTYSVTEQYVRALKPYCKIAYLGSKAEYLGNLDYLINYSSDINIDFYNSLYRERTKLLLGPSYAPMRKEFQHIEPVYRETVKRILLTTGNTDRNNIIPTILRALIPVVADKDILVDVVIGRLFQNIDVIHRDFNSCKQIVFHENVSDMSALMMNSDLAISANGTTVYELSAMGVPTISFAIVEEQVRSGESLGKMNIVDYCGRAYESMSDCIVKVTNRVRYYIDNPNNRVSLAKRAHQLIDGNGCMRIVDAITE